MDQRAKLLRLFILLVGSIFLVILVTGILITNGSPLSPIPPESPVKIIYMTPTPGTSDRAVVPKYSPTSIPSQR